MHSRKAQIYCDKKKKNGAYDANQKDTRQV